MGEEEELIAAAGKKVKEEKMRKSFCGSWGRNPYCGNDVI